MHVLAKFLTAFIGSCFVKQMSHYNHIGYDKHILLWGWNAYEQFAYASWSAGKIRMLLLKTFHCCVVLMHALKAVFYKSVHSLQVLLAYSFMQQIRMQWCSLVYWSFSRKQLSPGQHDDCTIARKNFMCSIVHMCTSMFIYDKFLLDGASVLQSTWSPMSLLYEWGRDGPS